MKKTSLFISLILLVIMQAIGQQTDLFLKPIVGKKNSCELKVDIIMGIKAGEKEMSIPMKTTYYFESVCKSIASNGNVVVSFTINRVYLEVLDPKTNSTTIVDSDKKDEIDTPQEKQAFDRFSDKIGVTKSATFSNKGLVLSTDNSLDQAVFNSYTFEMPKEKVSVGSTWEVTQKNETMDIEAKSSNKIVVIDEQKVNILSTAKKSAIVKNEGITKVTLDRKTGVTTFYSSPSYIETDMGMFTMKIKMDYLVK